MSTKVKTEKVTLYKVTWPRGSSVDWSSQRIVALHDVDKNSMFYRAPDWEDVDYDERHTLDVRREMEFLDNRMSHAEARRRGIFETPDEAKRCVWESLQAGVDRAIDNLRHAKAALAAFGRVVDGLETSTGEP